MDLNVNINADTLATAINNLAAALQAGTAINKASTKPKKETSSPVVIEPAAPVSVEAVPAVKDAPKVTLVQLRAKLADVSQASNEKAAAVKQILSDLGAARLSELAEDQYAVVFDKAAAL